VVNESASAAAFYQLEHRTLCKFGDIWMQVQSLYVLFEHATGYALFRVKEFEEIGLLQAQVEESVVDITRFSSVIKLVAFTAFRSGQNALDNMNSISEGLIILSTVWGVAFKSK